MDHPDDVKEGLLHNRNHHHHHLCLLSPTHNMQQQQGEDMGFYANPSQNPDFSSFFHGRVMGNSQIQVSVAAAAAAAAGFSPNTSSSLSNNESTPGGGGESNDHFQLSILNERRLKRMISNRESARRSRMRKKKQIEDLQSQVEQIQAANHQLSERLIHLLECNHQILQENVQLKEKVSSLQLILSDVLTPLRAPGMMEEQEQVPLNTTRLKIPESSNRTATRSMDLLL